MSTLSTHVLDTSRGRPAAGLPVVLARRDGDGWVELARGVTSADGRVKDFLPPGTELEPAVYRLSFDTAAYYRAQKERGFYPSVELVFEVTAANEHYHVPLLLSPYGFSTYRGS